MVYKLKFSKFYSN